MVMGGEVNTGGRLNREISKEIREDVNLCVCTYICSLALFPERA